MLRDIRSLYDAQKAVCDLDDRVSALYARDIDLKGRKVVNGGAATEDGDYVNRRDLMAALAQVRAENAILRSELERVNKRLIAGGL